MSTSEHIVASFDDELNDLSQKIAEMGGLCEQHVADSVSALVNRDTAKAQRVINGDERIDDLQRQVEESAVLMIARRQPMARDLREIMAAIHIANDLERVGDLAKNTAKRVIASNRTSARSVSLPVSSIWPNLASISSRTCSMLSPAAISTLRGRYGRAIVR